MIRLKAESFKLYNEIETFSKLVDENDENVTTNKILGSLEILAIKKQSYFFMIKKDFRIQTKLQLETQNMTSSSSN